MVTRLFHWFAVARGPSVSSVALTFDDGPDPDYTPRLLDQLHEYNIKATFFVLGEKAQAYPDLVRRMLREGHDVQIHGWKHQLVPILGPRQTVRQFKETQSLLKREFGVSAVLYRPTWGLSNLVTLLTSFKSVKLVTWSIMVGDWRVTQSEVLQDRIVRHLHKGAVIVLHDSDKTAGAEDKAPEQVISLIEGLAQTVRDRGYQFIVFKDWVKF
ncbi:polysaccharide deacetylase family protein [Alicyclobacillus sp. SO9]|nr:polysaccharide deacetylase family protein [Alicyclobacillus sp. SO9]